MHYKLASSIMRTTLDLELPILKELKSLSKMHASSLSKMASQLLAEALALQKTKKKSVLPFEWTAQPMGAKVDIGDKDALYRILEQKK